MFAIRLIVFTWYIMLRYETFSRLYVVTVHMTNLLFTSKALPFLSKDLRNIKLFYMVREQKEVQTPKMTNMSRKFTAPNMKHRLNIWLK